MSYTVIQIQGVPELVFLRLLCNPAYALAVGRGEGVTGPEGMKSEGRDGGKKRLKGRSTWGLEERRKVGLYSNAVDYWGSG